MIDEMRAWRNGIFRLLSKRADQIQKELIYDGIDSYPNRSYPTIFWFFLCKG
jgi:hypothetical protein